MRAIAGRKEFRLRSLASTGNGLMVGPVAGALRDEIPLLAGAEIAPGRAPNRPKMPTSAVESSLSRIPAYRGSHWWMTHT